MPKRKAAAPADSQSPDWSTLLKRKRTHRTPDERVKAHAPKYLEFAKQIAQATNVNIDESWEPVQWAIDVVQHILEDQNSGKRTLGRGLPHAFFVSAYSINVTVQQRASCGAEKLYEKYVAAMTDYLRDGALPSIRAKTGASKLQEFAMRWENHKLLSEFMRRFFDIVDRGFVAGSSHPSLSAVALTKFKDILFDGKVKGEMLDAMLGIVAKHRAGERDAESEQLLKACGEIFYTMGITQAADFDKIKCLVMGTKFMVPERLPLLPNATSAAREWVEVGDNLGVYEADYEKPFLVQSQEFFRVKANEWMATTSLPEYMVNVKNLMLEESERVDCYMHATTKNKVLKLVVQQMLAEPMQTPLLSKSGSGLEAQLDSAAQMDPRAVENIALIFEMVSHVDETCWPQIKDLAEEDSLDGGHSTMSKLVGEWMKKKGLQLVKERKERTAESAKVDNADDIPFVDKLIEFHSVCDSLVRKHFPAASPRAGVQATEMPPHPMYLRTMTSAWESIVNPPVTLKSNADPAQILAHYLDTVLRGHKGKTRLQTDQQQEICKSVVGLWDYLNDKVTFAETHASLLMRRLLKTGHGGRFVSDHATEDMLISLLKTKQTAQYTKKLETMFSDLTSGKSFQSKFQSSAMWAGLRRDSVCASAGPDAFACKLVTRNSWPALPGSKPSERFELPGVLNKCKQSFVDFYKSEEEDRNLKFHLPLCGVTIQLSLPKCKATITMETVQCAVLSVFRKTRPVVSYAQMRDTLSIEPELLQRVLLTLLSKPNNHCSGGLLLKAPRGKVILPTDRFKMNAKFASKMREFSLPVSHRQDDSHALEQAYQQKKQYLEAAIVRTMKARHELSHRALVDEVTDQIKLFSVKGRNCKRAIEGLIERGYMERHATREKTYLYRG